MAPRAMWIVLAAILVLAAVPAPADANLVCPGCEIDQAQLTTSRLVELVLTMVLRHGIGVLLAGAAFVVGLPWAIAGFAVAAWGATLRSRVD